MTNPNYEITIVPADLTITKADITVAADNVTKVYGESIPDDSTLTYQITSGSLVGSDTLSGSMDAIIFTPDTGNYIITQGTLDNTNYNITFTNGTLIITPAKLTITADTKTKVSGTTDPTLTYSITGSLFYGDVLSGSLTRPAGETVGSYQINQGTLVSSDNYTLTFVPSVLTITAKPSTTGSSTTNTVATVAPITTTNTDTVTPPDTEVLGDQTTTPPQDNASDNSSDKVATTTPDNNLFTRMTFGIYNWVWLIGITGALGGWWYIARRRS